MAKKKTKSKSEMFWELRRKFKQEPSKGFKADIEALEDHIKELEQVMPSDNRYCEEELERLRSELEQAKRWLTTTLKGV